MIKSYTLKFNGDNKTIKLDGGGITIFVGANNSGKSLVLKELESVISTNGKIADLKIIDDFEIEWPTSLDIDSVVASLENIQPAGQPEGRRTIGRYTPAGSLESSIFDISFMKEVSQTRRDKYWVSSQFLKYYFIRLDGRTRFQLTDDRAAGDLIGIPENTLAQIFIDENVRRKIREYSFDAFGKYFVIDPTLGGKLRIRLSDTKPDHDEQSLGSLAREFHSKATYIKDSSDGLQAYVGVLTAVLPNEYRMICIDEPEAFLHPPLARKLGSQLATIVAGRSGSLIASTHSADFLMGCVQASNDVRVVRLEYSNNKSKGRVVDPNLLKRMFREPLMRSANVVSALFYDGVVVTESDNDRVFYSEIYHRISQKESGLPSILFINAQNKQTIKNIIEPLRNFGVPAVAITDIDIVKDGGTVWAGWLKAAQIPDPLHAGYANQRDAIKKCFDDSGSDMKKNGGIKALVLKDKAAAEELFDTLSNYGIFVVKFGELESWLPQLGATGRKTEWVISILEKMGIDPTSSDYLQPSDDDVWKFVKDILGWVKDPKRKGTL